jgi:FHS family L-fucose permease-like MFS transporter
MALASTTTTTTQQSAPESTDIRAMSLVTSLFFMWGFLTALNDILIPHLKAIFDLGYAEVMLVQFAFFSSYFLFALPSGKIVDSAGYKRSMVLGLITMGCGALLFIPAAAVPAFPLFLGALIVLAAGMTILQVAANPYVSILGPPATASSRLNLTQAFNSLGTTIAPPLGGLLILSAAPKTAEQLHQLSASALASYRIQQASSVKMPYLAMAAVLFLIALGLGLAHLPHYEAANKDNGGGRGHLAAIWRKRHLVLGAIGIFTYVGAEVSIGSFLVNYFAQPDIGNMTEQTAAKYVAFYWGGAMVGRFIGSGLLQRLRANRVLAFAALVAGSLVCFSMLNFGRAALWSILLVGLFNSVMFPTIFTLGIAELGALTGEGSGLLIAAIVGGALIPLAQGKLADMPSVGIHHAFVLPVLCYLYIAFYGFRGYRPSSWIA